MPGLIDGFQSADQAYGVYVARLPLLGSLRNLQDVTASVEDIAIESFTDLFPATPTYLEDPGTESSYFMGLGSTAWRWYDYGTGYVRVGGGLTADGAVMMGIVYGPYDWFNGDGAVPHPQLARLDRVADIKKRGRHSCRPRRCRESVG